MELLVSYPRGHFGRARREVLEALRRLGDECPRIERTSVEGISLVHTALDAREVARRCRELFHQGFAFEHAIKWMPVDYWCEADLEAMRALLADKVRAQIGEQETWGMQVEKHRWQQYHTRDIVTQLAKAIDRKVDLDQPDKLVRVDFLGEQAAVSVLRSGDVFSATSPQERSDNRRSTMSYYMARIFSRPFETVVADTIERLREEGFGVLTDIDVQATLKSKLGAQMPRYRILGACNPQLAHAALQLEDKLGVLLPCNVIVRETADERVEVASVDPVTAMERTGNPALAATAQEVRRRLANVLAAIAT